MPSAVESQPTTAGPLSPAQERMWLLTQLDPASPAYAIPVCAWIDGPLEAEQLRTAWQRVAQLHDALRTRFPLADGVPECRVERDHQPEFALLEPGGGTTAEREGAALELARACAGQLFDLAARPPWRILLVRVAAERHLLVANFHHIIVDGASLPRLFADLSRAYAGRPDDQSTASRIVPYHAFTGWQRGFLGSARCAEQLAYWQRTLAELEPLTLPIDRPRPRQPTSNGARLELPLPEALAASLEARACELEVSTFSFLLATFAALIQRCTGAVDLPIATPVDNRATAGSTAPSFLRLVGMCINTVIIRAGCTGELPFCELARTINGLVEEAVRNADVPFDRVISSLRGGGGQANQALANLLFDVEIPRLVPRLEIPGLHASFFTIDNRTTMFDLVVSLHLVGKPSCSVRYATDLFAEDSIRRLLVHYRTLLGGIAADPRARIRDLPLLERDELETVTVAWNRTAHEVPTEVCIHQLFEAQVERTPDGIALVHERGELTYRLLNQRANQLSRQLGARGVGPEVLVGILLDRSPELVIAVLAVLKAGGAYVPCDRKMTASRIAYLVKDAGVRLVITQRELSALLPDGIAQLLMPLPADDEPQPAGEPASGVQAGNAAYVIYTSGSTGEPKGVVVEHRSAVNAIIATIDRYADLSCDRTLFQSSVTFDSSVTKIFQSLCHGGTLYIAPEGADFEQALALTVRYRIPRLTTTPSELALLNSTPERLPAHIEVIGAAGENLTISDVDRIIERIPILNIYGPTETTISTTCFRLTRAYPLAGGTVPIGKPIMNYRVYVLDRAMNPMPIGCIGELYIAGHGVARGYLNAPALTAQRFVPDPFTPGGRLYRSGDLARWLPDGNLEFKGRVDQQVKIRGFRIELGEIEHALGRHPEVRQAVVVARQAKPVGSYLTAYVVMTSPQASPEALRAFLAGMLPDYMVPARFMRLDEFPRLVSGKIDRKALPEPDWSKRTIDHEAAPPRNRREELLVGIWAQVLGIKGVGIDDDFFDLGGDSILSLQIIARANQAGLRLTLRQLFHERTIARLAAVAEEAAAQRRPAAEQGLVSGEVVLTPIQRWFFARGFLRPQQWNMARWLDGQESIDRSALERALQALLRHHDALRLRYRSDAGGRVQFHGDAEHGIEMLTLDLASAAAERQQAELAAVASRLNASLDLANGPLLRAAHADLGGGRSTLLLVAHHLIIDGVSWRVLAEDLNAAYRAAAAGSAIELPAKTASFKSWAARLAAHAASPAVAGEAAYWLAAVPPAVRPLPRDADGANLVGDVREVTVGLDREETTALLQHVPAALRTQINEVLLAALVQALAPWSGENALLVDLEGHGREDLFGDLDISRTVGWFTTMYPVWLDLRASGDAETGLRAVKECLRAIPNRGIGYGLLRQLHAAPEIVQRLARQPAAEVAFNYLGQFTQEAAGDAPFRWSRRAGGATRHPQEQRAHLLDIDGMVQDGLLTFTWAYSERIHRHSTIAALAEAYADRLRAMITLSRTAGVAALAPSDFPLAGLDQEKLGRLLADAQNPAVAQAASGRDIQDIFPLSGMQQLLLMHALRPGHADSGFLHYRCTFHGELDAEALRTAWGMVIDRCDILRTTFAWDGFDEPLQVVHRTAALPWSQLDWSLLSAAEQATRLAQLLAEDRKRGFALGAIPLSRITLIRMADARQLMLWSHHHLQTDGWSVAVIIREVIGCYVALRRGVVPPLEPRRPFRDYIAWLKERDLADAQRYWAELLRDFTTPTPLAGAPPAPTGSGDAPSMESARLACPPATMQALTQRAAARSVTLNTMISAAWAVVLAGASGRLDVVFGSTVSGRPAALRGVEDMVGTFINNLPVRIQLQPELQLAPWLSAIFRQQLASQEFDYAPLFRIEGWSGISARERLFDNLVLFDNTPDTRAISCGAGLSISDTDGSLTSGLPFTLFVRCREQLELEAIFDHSRLSGAQADRLLAALAAVLARLADPLTATVAELIQARDAGWAAAGGPPIGAAPGRGAQGAPAGANPGAPGRALAADGGGTPEQPGQRAPHIPLHTQLLGIWESLLGIEGIAITDSFFALGGHSLLAARMLAEASRLIGRPIPMTLLFEGPSIEQLAAAMLREFAPRHRPLIELTPGNGDPPFFFLHGDLVGGGYYTVELARLLGPQLPFQVLAPVTIAPGQAPPTIAAMASEHIRLIRAVRPHGPYRLGGYCNGGVVMYEAACQLIQAGEQVDFLGLIDATVGARRLGAISHAIELAGMALKLSIDQQLRCFAYLENRLGRLADPSELRRMARELCTRWWTPRPEQRSASTDALEGGIALRAYLWALARYRPQRFPGTLTLYMADGGGGSQRDHTRGWAGYAGRIDVRSVPGQHFDIITHQVRRLAEEMGRDMKRSAQATPAR